MYTKDLLESDTYLRLYKYVGDKSIKLLLKVEETIAKSNAKRDLDIKLNKETFNTRDNTMHYTSVINLNNNGTYLKSNITKTKGCNMLDINLELGVEGFDYSTGEKYLRKQAEVSYSYENAIVDVKEIKDEEYFNKIEAEKRKEVYDQVMKYKK